MKLAIPVFLVLLLPLQSSVAKGVDGADSWNKASDAERNALVKQVMTLNRGTYPAEAMRKCLDDTFAASAPAAQRQADFPTAAIICHAKLQPRK